MSKRILIIDDDLDLVTSLVEAIDGEGYFINTAGDGKEGIKLFIQEPYDLIITDIVMPEEDGLEVIMWIRASSPNTKIIAISGGGYFDAKDYLVMAKELGAHATLSKPFDVLSLKTSINKLLQNAEVCC